MSQTFAEGRDTYERESSGRFRISVDTGGTFTDVVISDERGEMSVGKAFTTYGRIFDGFIEAVGRAAATWRADAAHLLRNADSIIYATTHATNAVVTGKTARTGLITTKGFEDTLFYREGGRIGAFNARAAYPGPYVPRRLTFGAAERISAEGEVLEQLRDDELDRLRREIGEAGVEAVGVALLWSISNPIHEARIAEMLRDAFPDLPYSLSHEVNPIIREYRRASSVAIDASLKPLMKQHFEGLARDLEAAGFTGQCLVVTSEGGVQDLDSVASKPLLAVNSGPSMAPLAGASFAPTAQDVVVCDIGGTTFDVSLVEGGRLRHTRELWLGEPFIGELGGLASVAVKSVGSGGGSIARIDPGGLITVGPDSAGSTPGPAAYGKGGEEATVTDAAVVLGYLDPAAVADSFTLCLDKAEAVVAAKVGQPLDKTPEGASTAILKVAATRSAAAARQAVLEQGVDPRGSTVVACGGAGPLLGCFIADELEAHRVVIPSNAGVLAAYGAHNADILTEFNSPLAMSSAKPDLDRLQDALADITSRCAEFAGRFDTTIENVRVEYFVEARYPSQGWEIRVALGERFGASAPDIACAAARFHSEHEKRNGAADTGSEVEFVSWGARVSIRRHERTPRTGSGADGADVSPPRMAVASFDGVARQTPRYHGANLAPGWSTDGPAIIDESTTTVVVPPGWRAARRTDGSYVVDRTGREGNHEDV